MVISIANTKGGVAKTITTVHLGAALARAGFPVLLIDCDLQHGLSNYLDVEIGEGPTINDVLLRRAAIHDAARVVRPGLSLVPATAQLDDTERALVGQGGGEVRLRQALKEFDGAGSFVLIDCPSGWGMSTRNAMLASDGIIIPINSEPAALENAETTCAAARELGGYYDHDVKLLGVLLTCVRNTKAASAVASAVERKWGAQVFQSRIRRAEKINEMAITRETISDTPAGPVGEDYEAFAQEVIARCGMKKRPKKAKAAK